MTFLDYFRTPFVILVMNLKLLIQPEKNRKSSLLLTFLRYSMFIVVRVNCYLRDLLEMNRGEGEVDWGNMGRVIN